jgi:hypothetical protein
MISVAEHAIFEPKKYLGFFLNQMLTYFVINSLIPHIERPLGRSADWDHL